MKHLMLLRHAKSSWDHPELSDEERPLAPRGVKVLPLMGQGFGGDESSSRAYLQFSSR